MRTTVTGSALARTVRRARGRLAGGPSWANRPFEASPAVLAAAVIVTACAWYAYAGRGMYFVFDEWRYWDLYVMFPLGHLLWYPHANSLNAGLFAIWHLLAGAVGMTYWPYRAVTIGFFALSLVVLWLLFGEAGVDDRVRLFALVIFAFAGPTMGNLLFGWQLAWTGSIAFGLVATLFVLRQRAAYAAVVPLGTAVLLGPAGLGFVPVVAAVGVRLRRWGAVAGSAAVAGGWLYWRTTVNDPRHISKGLGPLHADYWRFVVNGAVASLRDLLGSYWPLAIAVALVTVFAIVRSPRPAANRANAALEALAIGGAVGWVGWWLLLAQGRWHDARLAPESFAPGTPRYAHVAVVMLVLCVPWALARLHIRTGVLVPLAAALALAGMAWGAAWARPYLAQAQAIHADVCVTDHPTADGWSTTAVLEELRRAGYLDCRRP